jgi:hypothetical protein
MRAVSGGRAFTKPANRSGKQKKQQVNPALRLPASVMQNENLKHEDSDQSCSDFDDKCCIALSL